MCPMGLLPDTQYCGLRMRRECRERFPRHPDLMHVGIANPRRRETFPAFQVHAQPLMLRIWQEAY